MQTLTASTSEKLTHKLARISDYLTGDRYDRLVAMFESSDTLPTLREACAKDGREFSEAQARELIDLAPQIADQVREEAASDARTAALIERAISALPSIPGES
jgi:hypothetical protein